MSEEYTCPNCDFTGRIDDFDTLGIEDGVWCNNCDHVVVPVSAETRDRINRCLQLSPEGIEKSENRGIPGIPYQRK